MKKKKFFNDSINDDSEDNIYDFEKGIKSENNEQVHSDYSDHIYVKESASKEQLYDRNNPIVRIILLVLGLIAVIGTIYYVGTGLGII